MPPPALHLVKRRARFLEVDVTRGLLLLLMMSSHAVGLSGLAAGSFFQSHFWLPRGWSAAGFEMLTGFTLALLFGDADPVRLKAPHVRARKVATVLLGSNLFFLASKYALSGNLSDLRDPNWWLGVSTLQITPTISAVLVPTILVLIAAPWLLALQRRIPNLVFACGAAVVFVSAAFVQLAGAPSAHSPLIALLFISGIGGFAIVPLASAALLGLVCGQLWSQSAVARESWSTTAVALAFVLFIALLCALAPGALVQSTFGAVLHFCIVGAAGLILSAHSGSWPARYASLCGRYSLFVFVAHRFVQQAMLVVTSRLPLSPPNRYAILLAGTLATIVWLCALRRSHPRVEAALTSIYL
jgi:hypothetical protein